MLFSSAFRYTFIRLSGNDIFNWAFSSLYCLQPRILYLRPYRLLQTMLIGVLHVHTLRAPFKISGTIICFVPINMVNKWIVIRIIDECFRH